MEDSSIDTDTSRCRTFLFGAKIVAQDIVHESLCEDEALVRTKINIRKVSGINLPSQDLKSILLSVAF